MNEFYNDRYIPKYRDEKLRINIIPNTDGLLSNEKDGSMAFVVSECSLYVKISTCTECENIRGWVKQKEEETAFVFEFGDFVYDNTTKQISLTLNSETKQADLNPLYSDLDGKITTVQNNIDSLLSKVNLLNGRLVIEEGKDDNVVFDTTTELYSFYNKDNTVVESWEGGCGGFSLLPNACPEDSTIISSLADIVNSTDLGGNYCLQANIVLDTTVHGVIDNFYGTINLNGYSLSHTGAIPFTNFRGKINQGYITTTIIDNITSNDDGVEIPQFQNLGLNSKLSNTCDCSVLLYGVISNTILFNITSNNLVIDSCKLSNSSFVGDIVNLILTNSYITVDTHRTDYISITNLTCNDTKIKYTRGSYVYPNNTSSYGLFKNEIGQTHNYNNCLISGNCSIGTVTGSSLSIPYEGIFTGEGITNITNVVIMLGTVSFAYNVNFGSRLINIFRGGGVLTSTNSFEYVNTKYIANSYVKYNDDSPTEVTDFYDISLITVDNFKNITSFDDTIWDLPLIDSGYIPNLKNGASYQNKDLISSLPVRGV